MKLTEEHKQKILLAKNKVSTLQDQCDRIYEELVKELNFEEYQKAYDNFTDSTGMSAPASWLFHIIFNDYGFEMEELNKLQESLDKLHE